MNFQFFDTLLDKSRERLAYLIEQIQPHLTKADLPILLENISSGKSKGKSSQKSETKKKTGKGIKGFIPLNFDDTQKAEFSYLTERKLQQIYKLFISREENTRLAVRWRFYQYLKISRYWDIGSIFVNESAEQDNIVDFIIENKDGSTVLVSCFGILELNEFKKLITSLGHFTKSYSLKPDKIVLAAHKTYRNIPLNQELTINGNLLEPELWLEWIDHDRPFNHEDLLIVNENDLAVAAFNFNGMYDFLEFVYKNSEGGRIIVYRQPEFFSESEKEKPGIEPIWRGIITKSVV
ncbi:MAG: hypothetical protein ACTSSI_17800 [Candidatus Helarchaeota archaeon]